MKVTLSAPKWDKEFEMPGVPRVGDTVIVEEKQWLAMDVEWNVDGDLTTVNVSIDPKPLD